MSAKIYLTGPESTGKTTLAKSLSQALGGPWVPEFARTYLSRLSRPYRKSDLLEIAKAQANWEDGAKAYNNAPVICDTGMLVLKVWSEYKYGDCNPWILKRLQQQRGHLHLLCAPDIPWTDDPMRENPADREALFKQYKDLLHSLDFRYEIITGSTPEARLEKALEAARSWGVIPANG